MIAQQRRLAIGAALLVGALAGCGTGQVTQTADQESAVNGASGRIGSIAVRDAMIALPPEGESEYPAGASAPMTLVIVNVGELPDRLVGVETLVAREVRVQGQTDLLPQTAVTAVSVEAAESTTSAAPTSGPAATTSGPAATTSAAPTSGPAATTTGAVTSTTTVTSGTSQLEPGQLTIVLTDLTVDVRPGLTVAVVLLFEQAGQLALRVPLATPDEPRRESD